MPTYDYLCGACGHRYEVFQKKPTRGRARKCPECGGRAERQISGGAGFLFKGDGFYATDYRSSEYRSRAEAEKKGDGEKSKKGDRADPKKKGGKESTKDA